MPAMVDTQIPIYALRTPKTRDSQEARVLTLSAQRLMQTNPTACISSLSVLEVLRGLRAAEETAFRTMLRRLDVRAVTGPVAIRAHALLLARGPREGICPRCLSTVKSSPCGRCNALVSRQQRLNDALIVATAEHAPDVDVLYTNDDGMLAMNDFVTGLSIRRLPLDADGPLFERVHEKKAGPDAGTTEES